MSYDLLPEIAEKMTAQGVEVDPVAFRNGLYEALERSSTEGLIHTRHQQELKFGAFLSGLEGRLWPSWRFPNTDTIHGDGYPLNAMAHEPAVRQMPKEMVDSIIGVNLDLYQPILYLLAKLGERKDWLDHYAQGGNLWEKVDFEFFIGRYANIPMPRTAKQRFFSAIYGTPNANTMDWVTDLVEQYKGKSKSQLVTTTGRIVPDVKGPPQTFLMNVISTSIKDIALQALMGAYGECRVAPYFMHFDSLIVPFEAEDCYLRHMSAFGVRVGVTRRKRVVPEVTSRFDLIDP